MAAGTQRELCNVCKERFDEEQHQPVALSCGHSFCRPCVLHLHNTQPPLRCPDCERIHEGRQPHLLPTNFLLLNIIRNIPEDAEARGLAEEVPTVNQNKKESCKETDSSSDSSSDSSDSDSEKEEKKLKKQKVNKRKGKGKKKLKEGSDKGKGSKENVPEPESKVECDKNEITVAIIEPEGPGRPKLTFHPKSAKGKGIMWILIIGFGILGGIVTVYVIAPGILESVGFSSEGVKKGSRASLIQSQRDKARLNKTQELSGDFVTRNFQLLQRAGVKGFDSGINTGIFVAGFIVAFLIGLAIASCCACCRHYRALILSNKDMEKQRFPLTQASGNPTSPLMISGTVT